MNIDILLKRSEATHKWLGANPNFMEWVLEWQKQVLKHLGSQNEPIEMYRAQGRLEVLNRLTGLKKELEEYQKGVLSGRFNKVT